MRTLILLVAVGLAALSSAGCGGSSGQRETCSLCRGSGRTSSGAACTLCMGRGHRELSQYEIDRRKQAEENLRKKEAGEEDGWWDTWGRKAGGYAAAALILLYLACRGSRRDGSPPAGSATPDS